MEIRPGAGSIKRLAAIVFATILISSTVLAGPSPWPMFRHDLRHTGRTTYSGPATPNSVWTFLANDGMPSSPSIGANGTVYVGAGWLFGHGTDSSLYAINPNGTLKWRYATGGGVFSSPAIGPDGTIYVASCDKYVYALEDSVTYGKLRWKKQLGNFFVLSSPAVGPDGNVYIGSADFSFYVLNPVDGAIRWSYKTNWCIISSPAIIDDGTIYIGSKDHHLYAFRNDLQTYQWAFATGTFYDGHLVDCSPAVGSDGTIYVGSDQFGAAGQPPVPVDTSFWAVNPDGTLKWALDIGNGVESSPAIGLDGTIYFGSYDSCLYAVADSGDVGIIKWRFRTGGAVDGSPTVDDEGIIYFGSRDSTIYALYPQDGSVKWSYKTGGDIESSPTIDNDGHLLIGSFDGKLYCLGTGAPDVGVVSVNLPDTIQSGGVYAPSPTFRNLRAAPQTFAAACVIDTNGQVIYADTISLTNFPGDSSLTKSFDPWVIGPDTGLVYHLTVTTILTADDHPYNDTRSALARSVGRAYRCGDANGDGTVNVGDAISVINYVFKGGRPPAPLEAGDANCDHARNVGDAVYVINYIFKGGPAPCCP